MEREQKRIMLWTAIIAALTLAAHLLITIGGDRVGLGQTTAIASTEVVSLKERTGRLEEHDRVMAEQLSGALARLDLVIQQQRDMSHKLDQALAARH